MAKFTNAQLAEIQVKLETSMLLAGQERFHANDKRHAARTASQTSYNRSVISQTCDQLAKTIQAYIESYEGTAGSRPRYLKLIKMTGIKETSMIALRSVFDMMNSKDADITSIISKVGQRCEDEYKYAGLQDKAPLYLAAILKKLDQKASSSYTHKKASLDAACRKLGIEHKAWDKADVVQLGAFLVELVANINFNGEPLLTKVSKVVGKNDTRTELQPSEHLTQWCNEFLGKNDMQAPCYAPCVVPPQDWTSPTNGGWHVSELNDISKLIRAKDEFSAVNTYEQMPLVYNAINALQKVGYKINSSVLDVLQGAFDCSLPLALPSFEPITCRPAPIPNGLEDLKGKELFAAMTEVEQGEFIAWKKDREEAYTEDKERTAKLLKYGNVLKAAKEYAQYDEFFFVNNMDYRQRVYCESTYLTNQGEDLQKGLLLFSEGEKLGFQGRYWLAVHGAGVWNTKDENGIALDKKSFAERARYMLTQEMADMVQEIVIDPLNNTQWCDADKPWQFLNWCYEWADLLDFCEAGNDHKDFVSYMPCANDGSCSGTQHYAAILRSESTAKEVNLVPNQCPNDIYRSAATVCMNELYKIIGDKETTEEDKEMAIKWVSLVNRSLAKTPVMTMVYGAAAATCRNSILNYLRELTMKAEAKARANGTEAKKAHDFEDIAKAAKFLTPILWAAVGQVQAAMKDGMACIKKVARMAAKSGNPLTYTLPTGFIVNQAIYNTKQRRVNTTMFGGTRITLRERTTEMSVNEMASASAPNFIHGHDSSHLVLVAHEMLCTHGVKSLSLIHDSFSTHAGKTNKLRRVLLQTFVGMYKNRNVLAEFLAEVEINCEVQSDIETPILGDLDLDVILKARYAFG